MTTRNMAEPAGAGTGPSGVTATARRTLAERIDRVPLAWPMALLVAAAVAFLIYAMPAALIARALAAAGIGGPVDAALRAGIAVVLAGGAGAATWLLFHRLDGPALPRTRIAADDGDDDDIDLFAPPVRRADAHPDAPARRPLFAGSDLADPARSDTLAARRAPLFPERADELPSAAEDEAAFAAEDDAEPDPPFTFDPDALLLDATFRIDPEPVVAEPFELVAETEWTEPAPLSPEAPPADAPLAEMMARLERGLAARTDAPAPPPTSAIRQALDDLRRMTGSR